ncbi:hypothetical protein GGF50DRAFT_45356 [Schizophyllum commune]
MTKNTDSIYRPLSPDDVYAMKYIAIERCFDFALYGVQVTLTIASSIILARRHGRSHFTLAAILGLFLSSTISTVAATLFFYIQLSVPPDDNEYSLVISLYRLNILQGVFRVLNYVLSDAVLVWRAWCLWPDSRLVKGLLLFLMGGTIIGSVAELTWLYCPGPALVGTLETTSQLLTVLVPLLTTNVVATLLIGTKVLYYCQQIKGRLGLFTQKTQGEMVLVLLLESGVAYILFWIVEFVLSTVAVDSEFSAALIYGSVSYHIAGIYPTLVLFVAIQGTTESLLSVQVSQAMRFGGTAPKPHEAARNAGAAVDSLTEDPGDPLLDMESRDANVRNMSESGSFDTRSGQSDPASSEGPRPGLREMHLEQKEGIDEVGSERRAM